MGSTATKTNVFNRALTFLGKERVTSFNDEKEAPRVMREIYDDTLDYMLSQHPWSFAKAVTELAHQGDAEEASGWKYKYALPVDFLQIVTLNNSDVEDKNRINFEIIGESLYTNETRALLKYVKRETTVGRFTAKFINALAYALARDVAKTLTEETGHQQMLNDKAEQALAEAKSMDQRRRVMPKVSRNQYSTYGARQTPWY